MLCLPASSTSSWCLQCPVVSCAQALALGPRAPAVGSGLRQVCNDVPATQLQRRSCGRRPGHVDVRAEVRPAERHGPAHPCQPRCDGASGAGDVHGRRAVHRQAARPARGGLARGEPRRGQRRRRRPSLRAPVPAPAPSAGRTGDRRCQRPGRGTRRPWTCRGGGTRRPWTWDWERPETQRARSSPQACRRRRRSTVTGGVGRTRRGRRRLPSGWSRPCTRPGPVRPRLLAAPTSCACASEAAQPGHRRRLRAPRGGKRNWKRARNGAGVGAVQREEEQGRGEGNANGPPPPPPARSPLASSNLAASPELESTFPPAPAGESKAMTGRTRSGPPGRSPARRCSMRIARSTAGCPSPVFASAVASAATAFDTVPVPSVATPSRSSWTSWRGSASSTDGRTPAVPKAREDPRCLPAERAGSEGVPGGSQSGRPTRTFTHATSARTAASTMPSSSELATAPGSEEEVSLTAPVCASARVGRRRRCRRQCRRRRECATAVPSPRGGGERRRPSSRRALGALGTLGRGLTGSGDSVQSLSSTATRAGDVACLEFWIGQPDSSMPLTTAGNATCWSKGATVESAASLCGRDLDEPEPEVGGAARPERVPDEHNGLARVLAGGLVDPVGVDAEHPGRRPRACTRRHPHKMREDGEIQSIPEATRVTPASARWGPGRLAPQWWVRPPTSDACREPVELVRVLACEHVAQKGKVCPGVDRRFARLVLRQGTERSRGDHEKRAASRRGRRHGLLSVRPPTLVWGHSEQVTIYRPFLAVPTVVF